MPKNSNNKKHHTKRYSEGELLQCIVFLIISLLLIIPILYIGVADLPYRNHEHPLKNIFHNQDFEEIVEALHSQDEEFRYISIVGHGASGVRELLQYYASENRDRNVLYREYTNNTFEAVEQTARIVKNFIENYLQIELPSNLPTTWIFVGVDTLIPFADIKHVQERNETDKIILISGGAFNYSEIGFRTYVFPHLKTETIKYAISEHLDVPNNLADILIDFYRGDVGVIFKELRDHNFTIEDHLDTYYTSLDNLTSEEKEVLLELCSEGSISLHGNLNFTESLSEFGVLNINEKLYWKDPFSILNYALQIGKSCNFVTTNENEIGTNKEQNDEKDEEEISKSDNVDQDLITFEDEAEEELQEENGIKTADKIKNNSKNKKKNSKKDK